ncbi:MAG: helix-hairpin-helix domain-containing protein [Anaerolineae bacterium]|nr:helix-hairpin-helix domain-containing protein [Anaerolineae bacterium]
MNDGKSSKGWIASFLILAVAVLIGAVALWSTRPQPVEITILPPMPTATATDSPPPAPITVYVTGAVAQPALLVSLPPGSRVQDAIQASGGPAENADLSAVNLASVLRDGDQIHVPARGETTALATPNAVFVFINSATAEELDALPEVGPALAAAIIAWREAEGPFTSLDDLDEVDGIGPRMLETLAPLISFELAG